MTPLFLGISTTLIAALAAFLATPPVARLAARLGLLDRPGERKQHTEPTPRLGGVAVFTGVCLSLGLAYAALHVLGIPGFTRAWEDLPLLIACLIIFLTGLADDLRDLSPMTRILTESLAAFILIGNGYVIDSVWLPFGLSFHLGPLAIPVTLFWFIGVANAFNLIDGIDGLLSSIGLAAISGFILVQALFSPTEMSLPALAMLGGLAGFVWWNWDKARIFIGDAGSLLVGFVCATLALGAAQLNAGLHGAIKLQILAAMCAVPLLDLVLALARRYVSGRKYFIGDKRHVHHMLVVHKGFRVWATTLILTLIQAGYCLLALANWIQPAWPAFLATLLSLVLVGLGVKWLDYLEFRVFFSQINRGLFYLRRDVLKDIVSLAQTGEELVETDSYERFSQILGAFVRQTGFSYMGLEIVERKQVKHGRFNPFWEMENKPETPETVAERGRLIKLSAAKNQRDQLPVLDQHLYLPFHKRGYLVHLRYRAGQNHESAPIKIHEMKKYLGGPLAQALALPVLSAPLAAYLEDQAPKAL